MKAERAAVRDIKRLASIVSRGGMSGRGTWEDAVGGDLETTTKKELRIVFNGKKLVAGGRRHTQGENEPCT